MDLLNTSFMNGIAARLKFLAARTGVIAGNIANADTPDYTARDISETSFARLARNAETRAGGGPLRVTDTRHIQPQNSAASEFRPHDAPDGEAGLNGNKVSIETQMMKLADTRMSYQLASNVYRKGVDMMRLAARGGR